MHTTKIGEIADLDLNEISRFLGKDIGHSDWCAFAGSPTLGFLKSTPTGLAETLMNDGAIVDAINRGAVQSADFTASGHRLVRRTSVHGRHQRPGFSRSADRTLAVVLLAICNRQ
jgi:hypothetical protein